MGKLSSRSFGPLAATVVLLLLPIVITRGYLTYLFTEALIVYIVAMGLNVLSGYGGQTSVGHGALVGLSAYVVGIGTVDYELSFWFALPLAIVSTTAVGCLFALPAARLSAWYFALITLGFAAVFHSMVIELDWLTHSFTGVVGIPAPMVGSHILSETDIYRAVVVLAVLTFLAVRNLIESRLGRGLVGLRDNPLAVAACGVPRVNLRLLSFTISSCLAALGGALLAIHKTVVTPDDFVPDYSITFLIIIVLGGQGRFGFEQREDVVASEELAAAWHPFVEVAIDAFGPERCMMESNFPPDGRSCGFVPCWNALKSIVSSYTALEKAALFHDTAARVYRI